MLRSLIIFVLALVMVTKGEERRNSLNAMQAEAQLLWGPNWDFSRVTFWGGPYDKDYSILGGLDWVVLCWETPK